MTVFTACEWYALTQRQGHSRQKGSLRMTFDPHNTATIPVGTPVVDYNGQQLGRVHEVHAHYILVGREDEHTDLDIPVHAITGFVSGVLHVSITANSATQVDEQETAHHLVEKEHPSH
jgi:hypothetical protein